MPRRHAAATRIIEPDVEFGSLKVSKFINMIMKEGKKSIAETIVYQAFKYISSKHKVDGYEAFSSALNNYQVPSVVDENRANTLAIRWIISAARKRPERNMKEKLAEELFEAHNSRGSAYKKMIDTHKMAEANKAFSHFSPKKTKSV